ncbi:hypothetical protein [Paenibacillus sp.]|nr:hypothetical protein [Paenibacillus sp.]HZG55346.1 hypothetical protein [Paenibacillus sp.]
MTERERSALDFDAADEAAENEAADASLGAGAEEEEADGELHIEWAGFI